MSYMGRVEPEWVLSQVHPINRKTSITQPNPKPWTSIATKKKYFLGPSGRVALFNWSPLLFAIWYMLLVKVRRERLNVKYVFVLSFVFVRKY